MASGATTGLLFYGVIDADGLDHDLLDVQRVSLVVYRDLAAVVAPVPYLPVTPGDAELQDFLDVLDALSKQGPVIPAPPGTVFQNEAVLSRWLDVHYAKLHEALSAIDKRDDGRPPYDYVRMVLGS